MVTGKEIVCVCGHCGFSTSAKTSIEENFYLSYSQFFKHLGRAPLCKNCAISLCLGKDGEINFINFLNVLYRLDKPYIASVLNSAKENKKTGITIAKQYMRVIVMPQYVGMTFVDGDLNIERILEKQADKINNPNKPIIIDEEDYESIEIVYLINKWGKDMSVQDLQWLEEKYNEWESGYEIDGKNRALIVTQICFEELYIYQERPKGKDVSKRIKTITDLMKQGNLSPKQETASETSEFSSFAEYVAKVEKTKPCYNENHELKDVDDMKTKLLSLAGAISRTNGKSNQATKVFDEEFKNYTLDIVSLSAESGVSNG